MQKKDKDYVLEQVEKHNVKFIRLMFTDVLGFLKGFAITSDQLEEALTEGMGFDGSSIEGYARIEESDMLAVPDPNTFSLLPWRTAEKGRVAKMICDIYDINGEPYKGDPRLVLKRMIKKAKDMGFDHFYTGPELEFFIFKTSEKPETLDVGGYFDLTPLDLASDMRKDIIFALQEMGIPVEYSHHEVGPSQHEIDLVYQDALTMADFTMMYRLVVKEVAMKHGYYATFMPKPLFGQNGSGMHVHQSLFRGDKNAFFSPDDEYNLSKEAKSYIEGLLRHSREIALVTNQWVNSYKRLVPGYEAPVYICWGRRNRSALVRVPVYKPGKEKATRVEARFPDPACNPYLAFAVMLAAGLRGIEEGYELREPIEKDVYSLPEDELSKLEVLPENLGEAIKVAEKSELLRETLGDHIFEKLIQNKKIEWNRYKAWVTDYELKNYLPLL